MPPKKKAVAKNKAAVIEMSPSEQDKHIESLLESTPLDIPQLLSLKAQGFEIDRSHSHLHLPLLHASVRRSALRKVEAALAAGADPSVRDGVAAAEPNEDPKKKKKAEPPKKKKETTAASEDVYATLVTRRVDEEDGGNALHIAVTLNNPEILSKLLSHPKAAELLAVKSLRGLTPLGLAASLGHTRLVRQILAILDLNTSEVDSKGRSLLFNAVAMCHADVVALLLPSFASTLEAALTDRQGLRAVALALTGASSAACATALALERGAKGAVVAKFPAETLELALKAGNAELAKLAVAGTPNVDTYVKVLEAAVATKSVASCRGLAEILTGKIDSSSKAAVLEALDDAAVLADPRDGGAARSRVLAELRTRLQT